MLDSESLRSTADSGPALVDDHADFRTDYRALAALIWRHRASALVLFFWANVLAATTAAYGALVGPVLRALFGGAPVVWPTWAEPYLPAPPSLETLRTGLPFVVVGVALVKALAYHRHTTGVARLGQRVVTDLRHRLHARVLSLPPDDAAQLGAGDLLSRATYDAEATERLVSGGGAVLVRDGLQVLALLVLCLVIDWQLALLTFGLYPLAFWPLARFARRLRRRAGDEHTARAAHTEVLHDQLGRLPLIQLSGATQAAESAAATAAERVRAAVVQTARIKAMASPLTEVMGAVALGGTLAWATQRIASGALAAEHVLSFFVGVLLLYQPVKGLVRAQEVIQPGFAAWARIRAVLGRPGQLPDGGATVPGLDPPSIEFSDVGLVRGGRTVLEQVSFVAPARKITALLGPNGAGKTSIVWALARLLEPSQGQILIGNVPLADLDVGLWRARIGWVTQQPLLGRGSLRDNICFGIAVPSDRLAAAIETVGLVSLIKRLPQGLDTPLGDAGAGLSGGEQRRVALARALVREPTVLVFDEADAHLDAAGVARLRTDLGRLSAKCTVLLITHDPETAALADVQVRLDRGRVQDAA